MTHKGLGQRLVLATLLAVGFVVVWGLLGTWGAEIAAYVVLPETGSERLTFLADGTPRVAQGVGRYGEQQYRDLEGNPVPPDEGDGPASWLSTRPLAAAPSAVRTGGDCSWDQRLRSFADGRVPTGYWYFVSDGRPDGAGYFVGYDSQSRACLGYLGTAGFRAGPPPAEEFIPFAGPTSGPKPRVLCTQRDFSPTEHPVNRSGGRAPRGSVSTWDVYVLGRDGRVYHADLQNRTVQVAWAEPGLRSAALVAGPADSVRGTPFRLGVRTDASVFVLDERGEFLQRYPLPDALRGKDVHFAETTAGDALVYWMSPYDGLATEVEYRIFRVAPDGRCAETTVTLPAPGVLRPFRVLAVLVAPSPVALGGFAWFSRSWDLVDEGLAANYPEALRRALAEFWPALALAQLLAAGLALLCYRRQVRYGLGGAERVAWPLFVLAFGLPGWVGYRFGRSWPVLAACPACTADVPRDRESCSRCAADFPPPVRKGTEVFA